MFRPEQAVLFPEAPLSLSFGSSDARAWWIIDLARIQEDRAAGRIRDLSDRDSARPGSGARTIAGISQRSSTTASELTTKDNHRRIFTRRHADLRCRARIPTIHMRDSCSFPVILLAQPIWSLSCRKRKGLPVFQSHGMQDEILPYVGAERLRDTLSSVRARSRMAQVPRRA